MEGEDKVRRRSHVTRRVEARMIHWQPNTSQPSPQNTPSLRGDTMATLFSQHSSNPLEVSSSDVHNSRRLRMLHACGGVGSSDDDYTLTHSGEGTASGWDAKALNGEAPLQKRPVPLMVDLDEDMSDEDTLACEPGTGMAEEEEETQVDDEDEEERTILLKPPDEQEQIAEEILDLEEAVPQLREDYKIIDRLGTGTFSSVYKAIDLGYHAKWYNPPGTTDIHPARQHITSPNLDPRAARHSWPSKGSTLQVAPIVFGMRFLLWTIAAVADTFPNW
jgi:hypothetical protein